MGVHFTLLCMTMFMPVFYVFFICILINHGCAFHLALYDNVDSNFVCFLCLYHVLTNGVYFTMLCMNKLIKVLYVFFVPLINQRRAFYHALYQNVD